MKSKMKGEFLVINVKEINMSYLNHIVNIDRALGL